MTKMKTIGVMLMACSITGKNHHGEHAEENTEQRIRDGKPEGNVPAWGLERLNLSSHYFLKRSKTDISEICEIFLRLLLRAESYLWADDV